jgi:hypothetical protein
MADSIEITAALAKFWKEEVLKEADFTYEDIKRRGGPSQPTLTKMLHSGESISAKSAKAIEDAIGLERGSLRSAAAGGPVRWRPEAAILSPEGATPTMIYQDRETYREIESIEDGYTQTIAWAHACWKAGADRGSYYEFIDASSALYKSAIEARAAGAPIDLNPRPLSDADDLTGRSGVRTYPRTGSGPSGDRARPSAASQPAGRRKASSGGHSGGTRPTKKASGSE